MAPLLSDDWPDDVLARFCCRSGFKRSAQTVPAESVHVKKCERRDLNPHGSAGSAIASRFLRLPMRLPIPPRSQKWDGEDSNLACGSFYRTPLPTYSFCVSPLPPHPNVRAGALLPQPWRQPTALLALSFRTRNEERQPAWLAWTSVLSLRTDNPPLP